MIRTATPADADAIAEVNEQAWLRAYVDVVPADAFARGMARSAERVVSRIADGVHDVSVLDLDGRVRAFSCVGPPKLVEDDGVGELHALYVEPAAQGAGVGRALHDDAVARLRGHGYVAATLWAYRDNEHARAFYAARGWTWDESAAAPAEWVAPAVRYRRPL